MAHLMFWTNTFRNIHSTCNMLIFIKFSWNLKHNENSIDMYSFLLPHNGHTKNVLCKKRITDSVIASQMNQMSRALSKNNGFWRLLYIHHHDEIKFIIPMHPQYSREEYQKRLKLIKTQGRSINDNILTFWISHALDVVMFLFFHDLFWSSRQPEHKMQYIDGLVQCKEDVTALLTHWNYVVLALTHSHVLSCCMLQGIYNLLYV